MGTVYKKMTNNGSISIPVALRRQMGIEGGDPMELQLTEDNKIILAPYQLRCIFCGTTDEVQKFQSRGICPVCKKKLIEGGMEDVSNGD